MLEKLQGEYATLTEYISYLYGRLKELLIEHNGYLSSTKLADIIPNLIKDFQKTQPVPVKEKPVIPVFTSRKYIRENVAKLLGDINVENTKAETRELNPLKVVPASKLTVSSSEQKKQDIHEKSYGRQSMCMSSSVTKVRMLHAKGIDEVYHISVDKSGRLSDNDGNLVQTDRQGRQLPKRKTAYGLGYHTFTQDGELVFTDINKKVIFKIAHDRQVKNSLKHEAGDQ
jgi:hypothetical protein